MGDYLRKQKHNMAKHYLIFLELSIIRVTHMVYLNKYSQKNNMQKFNQIVFGIIQGQEELKNKLEEEMEVAKGNSFYFLFFNL